MHRMFSGVLWKFLEKISSQLISFIVSTILARILLPEQYGVIAIVNVFIMLADVFLTSGLGNSLVQKKDSDQRDFSTVFYINLFISFVLYGVFFVSAPYIAKFYNNNVLTNVLRVLGLRVIISSYGSIQQAYISRHMCFKKTSIVTIFATMISGASGIVLALTGAGVWALVAQQLILVICQNIFLFLVIRWKPAFYFSIERAKELWPYGSRILFANFLDTLSTQMRSLLIGKSYSNSDLAYYNRGDAYPQLVLSSINNTLHIVLFASYSKEQDDINAIKNLVRKTIRFGTYLVFPMMAGLVIIAEPFITILLTEKWMGCVPYLKIACFSYATWILQIVNQEAIMALGKSNSYLRLTTARSLFSFITLFISLRFGVMHIALSALLTNVFSTFLVMHYSERFFGYTVLELINDICPNLLYCLIMYIGTVWIRYIITNNYVLVIAQIVLGIVLYFVSSILFHDDSINYIVQALKKIKR